MLEFALHHVVPILVACAVLFMTATMILERWYPNINKVKRSRLEVALYIENFLNGRGGKWDWDDFTSVTIVDPYLDSIRERCDNLPSEFPAVDKGHYCGRDGLKLMEQYVSELKQ